MVMSKVLPLSDVKARLSELIEEITRTHERLTVTRNGRPVAVVLSTDDLEAIEDTLAILSDPEAVAEIAEARAAIAAGDHSDAAEIAELGERLRRRVS
jgi:prevent-host-death family protein